MNEDNILLLHAAIASVPGLNRHAYLPVIERCGGVEGFFQETGRGIMALYGEYGVEPVTLAREEWRRQGEKELNFMQREDVRCAYITSPRYPRALKYCADAPLVLFYKGTMEDTSSKTLAIVGARKASERYKACVETIIKQIA
ncbi:MAG: DNA-processing protein DprA, partial [Odoribacteraceae bacterium]|nr:DNA-processing protein DprA [Odoribacteraceae bacterium]